jgi:ADP-ribose pyrophosphatase YjhB (NUDIX family)
MTNSKISTSCIIEKNGNILMIREKQGNKINWDIPAGGLNQGESVWQGVLREVHEETGLVIKNPCKKMIFQYIEENRITINFLFLVSLEDEQEVHSDNQDTDEAILGVQWFTRVQVQKMITEDQTENKLATVRLQSWVDGFPTKEVLDVVYE